MKYFFVGILLSFFPVGMLSAQVSITKKGKPLCRIVLSTNDTVDAKAANLLKDFVCRISGAELPIVRDSNIRKNDLIIGNGKPNSMLNRSGVGKDGFRILCDDQLHVLSGGGYGSVYAVVDLLEKYFGANYWSEREFSFVPNPTLSLPALDLVENPAFLYRQSQNYALGTDSVYKWWSRLNLPEEVFAADLWVHTFDKLLPSSEYGSEHPEFYSFFDGKRHPGKASQWCLSNPDVLKIVEERLDSIFRADPDKRIISVSQNDGNFTYCQCDICKAIDDYEGSHSGSLIYFINKLADRFPDKVISSLAYLYTMKPPKHIKPRPNVNIMLCSIDCNREVSLTENASGREFVNALEGWSRISDNIFVWDYGINFDNYLVPFPNFHVLGDNIRLFKKNNATMHFSQIAGSRGGDFAEMRTWLVSKLMWNPQTDTDSLTQVFMNGYYGDAAPFLYRYTKLMEGALIGSGKKLWIYDSPVTHKSGMLKPEMMRRYNRLFDQAEHAVKDDSVLLKHVRRSRLPLQYSELEIARTERDMDVSDVLNKLNIFEQRIRMFDVPILNERENSPVDYCTLYRKRYIPSNEKAVSSGAKIIFFTPPTGKYASLGDSVLTDNLYGGMTFTEGWVGWEGKDASFCIDLGNVKEFRSIQTDFLHQLGQWILQPLNVKYFISENGSSFSLVKSIDNPEDRDQRVKFVDIAYMSDKPMKARYIKVEITGTKICPHWHYGVGHPCWFFIDEVVVK